MTVQPEAPARAEVPTEQPGRMSRIIAGQLITRFGRWKAYLVVGSVVMTGGFLLLSTIDSTTGVLPLAAYMTVLGIGVGMLMQNLVLAAQNDVPDLTKLPPPVLHLIRGIYGTATSELFLVAAPIAFLAVLAVALIKEKPLSTLTGDERRAQEMP